MTIRMKYPFSGKIELRETGSDFATFQEIVVDEVYRDAASKVTGFQTVIDLGANIGLASLYFSHFSRSCRILSIEPNPGSYEILLRNMRTLSRCGRCRTLRAAAWGTHVRLSPDPHVSLNRFSAYRLHESTQDLRREMTVQGFTMPEILDYSRFDTVDLLKIDIEGAETELFRGRDLDWLSRVGSIAIEFHGSSRKACGFDDIMKTYEFEICSEKWHTVLARKQNWGFRRAAQQS